MLTLIISELKTRFKNPITWFIILLLCTLSGLNLLEAQKEQIARPFVGHNVVGFNSRYSNWAERHINNIQKEAYPIVYESLKLYDSLDLDAEEAISKKDYREMVRLISLWNLMCIKMDSLSVDPISDIMLKNDIYEMWLDVSNGITYESVDFRPVIDGGKKDSYKLLLGAKYHHNIYVNNIEPIYNDEVNNVSAIYGYFFKVVPIIIYLVIILFVYNNINKEKRTGTLKLILTQSINRSKFYISKWLSSITHIVVIFLIPPVLTSTIASLYGGFVTFRYPTFYLSNIFTRLKPIPNYFDSVERGYMTPELYPRVFGHIAPGHYSTRVVNPHPDIDIIPFYQYLLIAILLLILFIMFAVAFVQLISAIIDNELISLITTSVLVGGLTYISLPFTQERAYNLSPFTFFKISRIIEGTHNVTVLTSTIIMIVSTIVLLFLGCKYFNKKSI